MGLFEKMIKPRRGDRLSRAGIAAVQKKRLEALVKTAKEKSPYYRFTKILSDKLQFTM